MISNDLRELEILPCPKNPRYACLGVGGFEHAYLHAGKTVSVLGLDQPKVPLEWKPGPTCSGYSYNRPNPGLKIHFFGPNFNFKAFRPKKLGCSSLHDTCTSIYTLDHFTPLNNYKTASFEGILVQNILTTMFIHL